MLYKHGGKGGLDINAVQRKDNIDANGIHLQVFNLLTCKQYFIFMFG
jgi:hypothetical protein